LATRYIFYKSSSISILADRFSIDYNTGTVNCVVSQQAFTPGTAPVAGYESQYFLRVAQSAATASKFIYVGQKIEDVRTFAGQTVTFSFWAKANATKTLKSRAVQIFGSGGSGAVATSETSNTVTTSWTRFSNTITVGSVSGKTIGAGSYIVFDLNWDSNAIQDIDIWGVQVESGSVATAFQTATGTLQGELAACQRYYWRSVTGQGASRFASNSGSFSSSTNAYINIGFPVQMRTIASSVEYGGTIRLYDFNTDISITAIALTGTAQSPLCSLLTVTVASGGTQYRPIQLEAGNADTTAYIGFSAEL
jgi:hypothetical protein